MDTIFPFGLPFATGFYLVLYLGTLLVHVAFMNYVLAGSCYLAWNSVAGGDCRLAAKMRSWMPFMLSMAITAGIAPLLFLQILYKGNFYTANILLFYRWMAILPTLIAGFYLLYVLNTKWVLSRHRIFRGVVALAAFCCFLFVAWSWVENHILSLAGDEVWREQFAGGSVFFVSGELLPRLAMWFTAAFPTMALIVGWQMWYDQESEPADALNSTERNRHIARLVSGIALVGWVVSSLCIGLYFSLVADDIRGVLLKPVALPYLILAVVSSVVQFAIWIVTCLQGRLTRGWLTLISAALVLNFIGMAVVNECTRLTTLALQPTGLEPHFLRHQESWQVAGVIAFFVVITINGCLIAYCVMLTRQAESKPPEADSN